MENIFLPRFVARLACCRFGSSPSLWLPRESIHQAKWDNFHVLLWACSLSCSFERSPSAFNSIKPCSNNAFLVIVLPDVLRWYFKTGEIGHSAVTYRATGIKWQSFRQPNHYHKKHYEWRKIHKFFAPIFVQFVLGEKKRLQLNLNCMFCQFHFCVATVGQGWPDVALINDNYLPTFFNFKTFNNLDN